jgi:hypothetical protein
LTLDLASPSRVSSGLRFEIASDLGFHFLSRGDT